MSKIITYKVKMYANSYYVLDISGIDDVPVSDDPIIRKKVICDNSNIIIFDISDKTNTGHPLTISNVNDGLWSRGEDITDVNIIQTTGTAGIDGKVTLNIPRNITDLTKYYYYCTHHENAGGSITINSFRTDYIDNNLLQYIQNLFTAGHGGYGSRTNEIYCLKTDTEIKPVQNGNSFDYEFIDMCNNVIYDENSFLGLYDGVYNFKSPLNSNLYFTILNKNKSNLISISGENFIENIQVQLTNIGGIYDASYNDTYNFYNGNFTITVNGDFDYISIVAYDTSLPNPYNPANTGSIIFNPPYVFHLFKYSNVCINRGNPIIVPEPTPPIPPIDPIDYTVDLRCLNIDLKYSLTPFTSKYNAFIHKLQNRVKPYFTINEEILSINDLSNVEWWQDRKLIKVTLENLQSDIGQVKEFIAQYNPIQYETGYTTFNIVMLKIKKASVLDENFEPLSPDLNITSNSFTSQSVIINSNKDGNIWYKIYMGANNLSNLADTNILNNEQQNFKRMMYLSYKTLTLGVNKNYQNLFHFEPLIFPNHLIRVTVNGISNY